MCAIGDFYGAPRVTNVLADPSRLRLSSFDRGGSVGVNHQHLRAFHAIATEGSFSRAARRLNVAQPTLSQQIKALEGRHAAVLFEGRRPPLRLTPVGRELYALTRRMFATSEEIDE